MKGYLLSSGQMSTNTWLCGMGVGTERHLVWRSLQRILCGVKRFSSLRLKENLISYFWHGLGKTTRKLVSVQATIIMLPFIEDLLTTCLPFYVAYLNLSLPQPYVSGTIIISVSQMNDRGWQRLRNLKSHSLKWSSQYLNSSSQTEKSDGEVRPLTAMVLHSPSLCQQMRWVLLSDNSWISSVYACLSSRGTNCLCSRLLVQGPVVQPPVL